MQTIVKNKLAIGIGLGVVIVVVITLLALQNEPGPQFQTNVPLPEAAQESPPSGVPATTQQTAAPASSPEAQPAPAPLIIAPPLPRPVTQSALATFTAPSVLNQWVLGRTNTIVWSRAPGITSGLYLVNAKTKAVVGWITPSNASNQTSYTWNTREVFLSRTNPQKKEIGVGEYILRLYFDNKSQSEVQSAPFSIIYESQVVKPTYHFEIRNFAVTPAQLIVSKGDKLMFTNNDTITHSILLSGYSPFVIAPGASFTFDTDILFPSTYTFYSQAYGSLKANVTVQ